MTEEDLSRIEEMWREGIPVKIIAREIGYSDGAVWYHIKRNRDRYPRRYKRTEPRLMGLMVERVLAGRMTIGEVADILGCHYETVGRAVRSHRKARLAAADGAAEEVQALYDVRPSR